MAKVMTFGDPHSGKSCFIASLCEAAGEELGWVQVCPDGEGRQFHALMTAGQTDEARAYKLQNKGKWSPEYALQAAATVDKLPSEAHTMLDAGGMITAENRVIGQAATHAVILYKSEATLKLWEAFAKECGLTVIATIESSMEGAQSENKIVGLKRGVSHAKAPAIQALVSKLASV